jgi:hypothetical protein
VTAPPPPKKAKVFIRQRLLEGSLRTMKVRMLPDAAQRRELGRHFAAA